VTYWTGIWRPGLEALSNEVDAVRRALSPGGPVVSFSTGQRSHLAWQHRAVCLSGRRWLALRALAAVVEPTGRLTHAWGAVSDWHFPRALGRRPVVFTVAFGGRPHPAAHYDAVRLFAVEAEPLARALEAGGIAPSRIRVVPPGVDLGAFAPGAAPEGRFQLLFASAPADTAEFAARGIPLLVDTARACPDIDVVLLRRDWGRAGDADRALAALDPPANVKVVQRGERTMAEVYQAAHAVACVYADGFGKTTPNSVVEGLACGRPAVVSRSCGIADLLTTARAGHAADRSVAAVAAAVRDLQHDWPAYSARARELATRHFGLEAFIAAYAQIYTDILG
jgi:glycosyltransferase involved in cell wall biosynthesis